MAKDDARASVVSVRITEDEQARLREKAEAQGITVSELIRTAALAQVRVDPPAPVGGATTVANGEVNRGVFWDAPPGAEVSGNTLTI